MHSLDGSVNQSFPENNPLDSEYNPLDELDPFKDEMYIYEGESAKIEGEDKMCFKKVDPETPKEKIVQAIKNEALLILSKTTEGKTEIKTSETLAAKIQNAKVINLIGNDNTLNKTISTKDVHVVVITAAEINNVAMRIFQIIEMTNKRVKERQEEIEKERKDQEALAAQIQAENKSKSITLLAKTPTNNKKRTDENNLAGRINTINDKIKTESRLNEIAYKKFKDKKLNEKNKLVSLTTNHKLIEAKYNDYFERLRGIITEKVKDEEKNDSNPAA